MTSENTTAVDQLAVPDASVREMLAQFENWEPYEVAADVVRVVAAPVVAAELRRIADAIDPFLNPDMYGGNDQRDPQVETILNALFARARELDPTGHP